MTKELEKCSIRLNKEKPKITIRPCKTGGVEFTHTVPLTKIDEKMVKCILQEYKMHSASVKFGGDYDVEDLIDTIEGNRRYIKCMYLYNKIDTISIEDVDELVSNPQNAVMSVHMKLGIDILMEKIWDQLGLVRVYTKRRGEAPDFTDPLILTKDRHGISVKGAIMQIHKDLLTNFSYASVWGRSCKFNPQKVGLTHIMADEDVIQISKN